MSIPDDADTNIGDNLREADRQVGDNVDAAEADPTTTDGESPQRTQPQDSGNSQSP
jgi:hypothetical protein